MLKNIRYFYDSQKALYELTNFYQDGQDIVVDNIIFPSNEHYFQWSAFNNNPTVQAKILRAQTASDAFNIAQANTKDNDWRSRADKTMLKGLIAKFSEKNKQDVLLSTKDSLLVEDSTVDKFWGVGADGKGENKLGLMLMAVRTAYEQSPKQINSDSVWNDYQALRRRYKNTNYGPPNLNRQQAKPVTSHARINNLTRTSTISDLNSPAGRVSIATTKAGYKGVTAVFASENTKQGEKPVIKIKFNTKKTAADFAKDSGNAKVIDGTTVILGSERAPIVFNKIGVPIHGRTNQFPMYNALCKSAGISSQGTTVTHSTNQQPSRPVHSTTRSPTSAMDRVKNAIKQHDFGAVSSVVSDQENGNVIKITFDDVHFAEKFASTFKNGPHDGYVVTLNAQDAQQAFSQLGVGSHGRKNPHTMYDAICYETKQQTNTHNYRPGRSF